jgi:hypothetical protein
MNTARVALANLRFPSTPDESVRLAAQAIGQAGAEVRRVFYYSKSPSFIDFSPFPNQALAV